MSWACEECHQFSLYPIPCSFSTLRSRRKWWWWWWWILRGVNHMVIYNNSKNNNNVSELNCTIKLLYYWLLPIVISKDGQLMIIMMEKVTTTAKINDNFSYFWQDEDSKNFIETLKRKLSQKNLLTGKNCDPKSNNGDQINNPTGKYYR